MTNNREDYASSEYKKLNDASYDAMQKLVAQVERMGTRIGALEEKVSRLQVEVNRMKGSMSMEDTSKGEDQFIELVGSKLECGHDQSKNWQDEEKSLQRGVASQFQ